MGRRPKSKSYSIVEADGVCCVSKERTFDPESDPDDSLMDELQCAVADEVLIAPRKAFSLTFPRNPFLEGLRAEIEEIRRLGVDALKAMPEVLADLGLAPIPTFDGDPVMSKARLFKFVFAPTKAIDITVRFEGKRRRLLDVVGHQEATPLLTTLRAVVSDTFAEAHNEDQMTAILRQIRRRIHSVLPAFNACLESIEIEPVAEMMASGANGDSETATEV